MSYSYQWKRGGVNISGATASTYTLVTADIGAMITATVTATNTAGSASATAAGVGPVTAGSSTALQAQAGSFAFAGQSATLTPPVGGGALSIQAQPGSFAVSGESMEIVIAYLTQAGAGAFAFAGQSANLTSVTPGAIQASAGAFALAGQSADLKVITPASYTGPGEVTGWGTAYGYWGLRAYTAAKIGANCIDVCSNINGAAVNLATVVIGSDGYANLTPIGFSPIYINRIYDQSTGGQDMFIGNTEFDRPVLITNAVGGKPAIDFSASGNWMMTTANATVLAAPLTVAAVTRGNTTISGQTLTDGSFSFQPLIKGNATISQYLGTFVDAHTNVANNLFAALASICANAAGGIAVNGTIQPATGNVGPNGIGTTNKLTIGGTDGGGQLFTGHLYEIFIKAGAKNATECAALSVNQRAIGTGF
jgi:hypothetical protein